MAIIRPKNVPVANLSGVLTNTQLPTLDYSKVPVGSIIQTQHYRYDANADTYDLIAQDTRVNSALTASFIPRFANSKLYISARIHVRIQNANGVTFGITRDGAEIDGMINRNGKDFFYKGDQVNHHYTGHCEAYLDATTVNATTFRMWAQGWSGGTWEMSYGHGEHCMTIMEIKQ